MNKVKKYLPNMITIGRIVSSVLAPILFLSGSIGAAIGLYCYGMVSDFLDGYTARKFNAYSEFGRKLDAVSDKIFALSVIIPSLVLGNMYMFIPLLLEVAIAVLNGYYQYNGVEARTIWVGKYKTVMLFPTMVLGLVMCKIPELINLFIPFLVVSSKLQVQSCVEYINQYRSLIAMGESNADLEKNMDVVLEKVEEEKDKPVMDKLSNMKDEFVYYFTKDVNLNKSKRKVKILKLR